jgi:hypothetical protein
VHQVNLLKNIVIIFGETSTFRYMACFEVKEGFSLEDGLNRIHTSPLKGYEYDPSHLEVARRELTQWVGENLEVLRLAARLSSKLEHESTVAILAARIESQYEILDKLKVGAGVRGAS